jgi:glucose/arabinose dehydrogenase
MNRLQSSVFVRLRQCLLGGSVCMALAAFSGSAFAVDRCGSHVRLEDPISKLIPASSIKVKLETIAIRLVSPVGGAVAPGMPDRIFVFDQIGKIWAIDVYGPRRGEIKLLLDVSSQLVPLGLFSPLDYDERGLLGLAFHPDFHTNGLFYTFTSEPAAHHHPDFSTSNAPRTLFDPDNEVEEQSVITEWRMARPGTGSLAVALKSKREVLRIAKPQFNHNGGTLAFGPDKLLYISLGDGGNANDEGTGHAAGGNAQSLAAGNVLGKILRIDPLGRNSANGKYGIPADNPFVGKPGADEIYARGFRNPFRISFDSLTGKLWAGDVGQNDIEEIDIVTAGHNYGWPIKEGTFLFDDGSCLASPRGFVYQDSPQSPPGLVDPIAEYDHRDGAKAANSRVAIVGGYVYRGASIAALKGRYLFGDYSADIGAAAAGHMFVLDENRQVTELIATNLKPLSRAVLGWVQDHKGEIYVLTNGTGAVKGSSGAVMKLKSASPGQ